MATLKVLGDDCFMATMKSSKHEMLRSQWIELINQQNESGLSVRRWCLENHVSASQYYYWLKIVRQDTLIKAGTLAITGQTQFAKINTNEVPFRTPPQTACAVIRSNGQEIEINNGADLETLQAILSFVGRL